MSIFTKIVNRYKSTTPRQFVLAGVFMLAFAAAIGAGFASKHTSVAATLRDCDLNSIDYVDMNGGCGALTPSELVADAKANKPGDLKAIYAHFGLGTSSDYSAFVSEAKQGTFYRTGGEIKVNGETVATDGQSMGRGNRNGSTAYTISGVGTYYYGTPNQRWASGVSSIPAMVWFDDDGTVKLVVMNPCGNPVPYMNKIKSGAECKGLNKYTVDGKKNTYQFNAVQPTTFGLAKVVEYQYWYNDGSGDKLFDTTTSSAQKTKEITFTRASTVTLKIKISLPGGKTKLITSILCSKEIGVVKEEVLHVCEALIPGSSDNITFRFTVKTKQSVGVTVKSADFTTDGQVTATGVTKKDADGNIVLENQTYSDSAEHTVAVKQITFVVDNKDVVVVTPSGKCQARVTRQKTPECKPNIPVGSKECEELFVTGPAGTVGLFTGVAAAGAAAHRLFMSRRARREQ
jgi:hypothetical protein